MLEMHQAATHGPARLWLEDGRLESNPPLPLRSSVSLRRQEMGREKPVKHKHLEGIILEQGQKVVFVRFSGSSLIWGERHINTIPPDIQG